MTFLFSPYLKHSVVMMMFVIQLVFLLTNVPLLHHLSLILTLLFIYKLQRLSVKSLAFMNPIHDLFFFLLYLVSIFNHVLFNLHESVVHSSKLFVIVCIIPFYLAFAWLATYAYYQSQKNNRWMIKLCTMTFVLYPISSLVLKWLITANLLIPLIYLLLLWQTNESSKKQLVR
ncbi:hypothetical protein [Bacillus sp. CGMCC 1.16541]|uniref:hypothetical protein n=1 Tax=Bacillus sp. CGMCC 1.16541 TaxID=2185143 RepID=UPI000D73FA26|nr:hypothetical protein [Bacillus sp. CGMCC 1.16541]